MEGVKFSLGYNNDLSGFISILEKNRQHIESVYFPIPKKYLGSGRMIDEPHTHESDIKQLMQRCNELGIKPFLLLNSTLVSASNFEKTLKYVKTLYEKNGLRYVIVTDPYLMTLMKKNFKDIFIEASTLCRIKNIEEAKYFKELGVDRITSDREIIRDLKTLKSISKILPIKVLSNEGCMKNCIYKYSHYNMLSSKNLDEPFFAFGQSIADRRKMYDEMDSMCVLSMQKHPYKFFSSPFIRPEDLKKYEGITNVFKLSTRNFETLRIQKVLEAYINQKYSGNLVDLLNTSYIERIFEYIDNDALNKVKFFETLASCDDNCNKCGFCKTLMTTTKVKLKTI